MVCETRRALRVARLSSPSVVRAAHHVRRLAHHQVGIHASAFTPPTSAPLLAAFASPRYHPARCAPYRAR